jgi:glycosyltransferase involved in cell wall biosynthesis
MKHIFVIVPSGSLDSPIRGACALANELSNLNCVTFVTLKGRRDAYKLLNNRVDIVDLACHKSWYKKLRVLKKLLVCKSDNGKAVTISMGLSADFLNSWCGDVATTCSSVRGDLPKAYVQIYGSLGKLAAYLHLKRLRKINHVVSMTKSMALLVESYIGRNSPVIGNFVDEFSLEKYRRKNQLKGAYKFVYTGSLTNGKQPSLLVSAISELLDRDLNVELDILGMGPLLAPLRLQVNNLSKPDAVNFYGFLEKPYTKVSNADVLVLPSLTEGVSRSVLEALYLGIPCVLRNIEGSSEVILPGVNGELFQKDKELADTMLRAAVFSRTKLSDRKILTLSDYRQESAVRKYITLLQLDCLMP